MKYYIIAGEPSGDMHGCTLMREIQLLDDAAVFAGTGGDRMQAAGLKPDIHIAQMAFMGFYEVIKNLLLIRRNFNTVKQSILAFRPDVVVLVDYPGFNLRMAKWCKRQGLKVVYYISPTIWAWNEKRVDQVRQYVDAMLCILPFETAFYEKHQYTHAYYVGHPLLDFIAEHKQNVIQQNAMDKIALLPGSRSQELRQLLPLMLEMAVRFPQEQFVIAGISRLSALYPASMPENVSIRWDDTYNVLAAAKAALVCSGTATLETALMAVPQVVVYKTSWLNYQIGKRVIKVDAISLPNLIAGHKIVEELIQYDCHVGSMADALTRVLEADRKVLYRPVLEKIGEKGAGARAAQLIVEFVGLRH